MSTHPDHRVPPLDFLFPVSWFREEAATAGVIPRPPAWEQPQDDYLNRCWRAASVRLCPRAEHVYKTGWLCESDDSGGMWEGLAVLCHNCGIMAPYTTFDGEGWYEDIAVAMVRAPYAEQWRAGWKADYPRTWFLTSDDPEVAMMMTGAAEWRA